jgi:hypothetical protein
MSGFYFRQGRDFHIHHDVEDCSEIHQASCQVGIAGSFLEVKATRA